MRAKYRRNHCVELKRKFSRRMEPMDITAQELESMDSKHSVEDGDAMDEDSNDANMVPEFPALSAHQMSGGRAQYIRIPVPPHRLIDCSALPGLTGCCRMSPLRDQWLHLYSPIVEHMKLQIRFNPVKKCVEIKTSPHTDNPAALQKAADFLRAFMLGFEVKDAIALLRLEDLYIDSFEIKDVKTLQGDNLSRAIGRLAGVGGKTKFTIENATRTRIVIADTHIHILGAFQNINIAKDAMVRLIMGSPPGKVYTQMRAVAGRLKDRL